PAVPHLPRSRELTGGHRPTSCPPTAARSRSDMRLRTLVPAALGSLDLAGSLVTAGPLGSATADDFSKPDRGFAPPNTVLSDAIPASVGLDPAPIAESVAQIHAHEQVD